jgi:hypothetical protein
MAPFALLLATQVFAGAHTTGGYKPKPVDPDKQLELREYLDDFIADMDNKYFGRIEQINGGVEFEEMIRENEWSEYDIQVTRGDIMEKTGRMLSIGKKLSPGRGDGVLTWGRFYSLDMHPKTPLVGMLHATIVMQMFEDNTVATGGWLGVMPGTKIEVDLKRLKQLTDDYFAKYDKDPALYRRLICKGTEDTIAEFRRKPACSGVSFYGPPVFPGDPEASIKFIAGLYDLFVDEFVDITVERADDAFTAADIAAQDQMRRQWLIDQLFSDPFASKIVPFEIWSFANVPPVVKF